MIINIIILFIFILSVIFTIKYKFTQLKFIKPCKEALFNKSSKTAFLLSLGSHIGAGNILGVTTALILGGPGTLFWMIICTLFTTIFSLMENTIALKYTTKIDDERRGGSPYYILFGLKNKKLATFFSLMLVLSGTIFFLPIQVKGVSFSLYKLFNLNNFYIICLLLIFSFVFIFQGTKTLTKVINIIVPIMTIVFLVISFYALFTQIDKLPYVLKEILLDAFDLKSGFIGVVIVGLKRSLFSNEAGLGTAPSINCYSDNIPIKQSYLQVLTCFIDTIIMCVLLGIVILLYDVNINDYNSEELSIMIFEYIFPGKGLYIGCFILFTFSLATIISSYYSGETNMLFNVIKNKKKSNILKLCYKMLFIIGLFIGVFFDNSDIWGFVDIGLVVLGLINIIVIIKLKKDFEYEL